MKKANELLEIVKEAERREKEERMARVEEYINNLLILAEEKAKQGYYYIFDDLVCDNDAITLLQTLGYTVEKTRPNSYKISWYE